MALIDKITALAAARGKRLVFGPDIFNCEVRDDGDAAGPYLTAWSIAELGAVPTLADGFTADELRVPLVTELPPTPAPTADQVRDEALLADADRQALLAAIRNATPAQIKTYINNNVTDLASARTMLTRIALLIALIVRR